jgi:aminopeptidase C
MSHILGQKVQDLMSEPENDGGQWGKTASFLSNER